MSWRNTSKLPSASDNANFPTYNPASLLHKFVPRIAVIVRIVVESSRAEAVRFASEIFCQLLTGKPSAVLGLATGGTMIEFYKQLILDINASHCSLSRCTTFNLDEYVGVAANDPASYRSFMQQQLFDHVDIDPNKTHLPDGVAKNLHEQCRAYEQAIVAAGGIDLQLLGIGSDGHIGFNEPGSSLGSITRVKTLADQTRRDNARFFNSLDAVPRLAITMGVQTIMDAAQILLLATGQSKADAIAGAVEGPISAQNTASILQLHPAAIIVLDEAAASKLQHIADYKAAEVQQRQLSTAS